jgi:hypothetical protein
MDVQNYLEHIGVLGMRWGKRKGNTLSGAKPKSSSGKKNIANTSKKKKGSSDDDDDGTSADHKKVAAIKKKKLSELSNEEIQTLVARINVEKQYKDATRSNRDRAKAVVAETLVNIGKQSVTNAAVPLVTAKLKKATGQ